MEKRTFCASGQSPREFFSQYIGKFTVVNLTFAGNPMYSIDSLLRIVNEYKILTITCIWWPNGSLDNVISTINMTFSVFYIDQITYFPTCTRLFSELKKEFMTYILIKQILFSYSNQDKSIVQNEKVNYRKLWFDTVAVIHEEE